MQRYFLPTISSSSSSSWFYVMLLLNTLLITRIPYVSSFAWLPHASFISSSSIHPVATTTTSSSRRTGLQNYQRNQGSIIETRIQMTRTKDDYSYLSQLEVTRMSTRRQQASLWSMELPTPVPLVPYTVRKQVHVFFFGPTTLFIITMSLLLLLLPLSFHSLLLC